MKEKICAVVVTYNRKKLLGECLDALLRQTRPVDSILVIDNASSDGTEEFLKENCLHNPAFEYVRLATNTGGAGGFYEGIKRAYEAGWDWIWVMDDDVEPHDRCLELLFSYGTNRNVLIPARYDFKTKEIVEQSRVARRLVSLCRNGQSARDLSPLPDTVDLETFSFEGPLFNRSIVAQIGFPRKDFFICADDTEYALRIQNRTGERPLLVTKAPIYRKLKRPRTAEEFGWKYYYTTRNRLWVMRKYGRTLWTKHYPYFSTPPRVGKWLYHRKFSQAKMAVYAFIDHFKDTLPVRYLP